MVQIKELSLLEKTALALIGAMSLGPLAVMLA
jgi:hypothetical protein